MMEMGKRVLLLVSALAVALTCPATSAGATAGEPDPSFGAYGLTLASVSHFTQFPRAIAIDGKGRIVVVGDWVHMFTAQPVVARFEPNGFLDPSFGHDGIVEPRWNAPNTVAFPAAFIEGVAIDSAGRIVLGGTTALSGSSYDFAVGRLLEDGSPDPTFGEDGLLTIDSGSTGNFGTALAIDGQGRILLGGTVDRLSTEAERATAIRVTPEGSLDPTFGGDGIATAAESSNAEAIAIEPSGAVLLAGGATVSGSRQFFLARFDSHGNLDSSLGGDGQVTLDPPGPPGEKVVAAVAVDGSRRLLLAGREGSEGNEAAPVVRLLADGSPDPSFGVGGTRLLPLPQPAEVNGMAIDPRGRIVAVGGMRSGKSWESFLGRLDSKGAMDMSFGREGFVLDSRLISAFFPGAQALAIDPAGRYLIAAEVLEAIAVARYLPEAAVAPLRRHRCRGQRATIVGTRGRDVLKGTKGRDVIVGLRGNDAIRGLGGSDLICGGPGRDRLFGGKGNDKLFGGKGADLLVGGPGRDRLHGGHGRDLER